MCPHTSQINRFAVKSIDEDPVGLDVTISKTFPFPLQRMVAMPWRQLLTLAKQFDDLK